MTSCFNRERFDSMSANPGPPNPALMQAVMQRRPLNSSSSDRSLRKPTAVQTMSGESFKKMRRSPEPFERTPSGHIRRMSMEDQRPDIPVDFRSQGSLSGRSRRLSMEDKTASFSPRSSPLGAVAAARGTSSPLGAAAAGRGGSGWRPRYGLADLLQEVVFLPSPFPCTLQRPALT